MNVSANAYLFTVSFFLTICGVNKMTKLTPTARNIAVIFYFSGHRNIATILQQRFMKYYNFLK